MSHTKAALQASAAVSQSSAFVPFSANLTGTSTAIADLLRDIDDDLTDAELFKLALEDSQMRAQRKQNLLTVLSHPSVAHRKEPKMNSWATDEATARIIQASALCCKSVYRKDWTASVPRLPGYAMEDVFWSGPSLGGREKAFAVFKVQKWSSSLEKQHRTTIVVAVRGSASTVDWMVNMNSRPTPCPDLVNIPSAKTQPLVHRGFADCATSLAPLVDDQIRDTLESIDSGDADIVFTGHSAGGAVAALLYCRLLTVKPQASSGLSERPSLSCLTFGAPPLLNADIGKPLDKMFSDKTCPYTRGITLAMVAEGDPVPRMDATYASSLAKLYNQVGGNSCISIAEADPFRPGMLELHSLGEIVMLHDSNEQSDELRLRATVISHDYLRKCVWGNLYAHKMEKSYVEWTSWLGEGWYNSQRGHPQFSVSKKASRVPWLLSSAPFTGRTIPSR